MADVKTMGELQIFIPPEKPSWVELARRTRLTMEGQREGKEFELTFLLFLLSLGSNSYRYRIDTEKHVGTGRRVPCSSTGSHPPL